MGNQINPFTGIARFVGRVILTLWVVCVVAAILFPVFSQAKLGSGRPKPGYLALYRAQKVAFSEPVEDAISSDDLPKVESLLKRYNAWNGYIEDERMQYAIAVYFAHKGLRSEAHKQLDAILHPSRKQKLTIVETNAEFMSLWYATAVGVPLKEKERQLHDWAFSLKKPQSPEPNIVDGLAKVEYLAGEECLKRHAPNQALTHFENARRADPKNAALRAALDNAKKATSS